MERFYARKEWKFACVLGQADRPLAALWWTLLVLRGLLPALLAVGMGLLVAAVQHGDQAEPLDGSRVVESGKHEELLARGGQYAEMYRIQASAYR